jgi:hypothetical protein
LVRQQSELVKPVRVKRVRGQDAAVEHLRLRQPPGLVVLERELE